MSQNMDINGPSKGPPAKNLGPIIRICQINIEGISRSKCQVLHQILSQNEIDVVAIQETHAADEEQLSHRGKIPGYHLVGATYHHAYGVATYARTTIENASLCSSFIDNDIHKVTIKIGDVTISNIYKPPATSWPPQVIATAPHPAVYLGDFNSHHTQWKYRDSDENGEKLASWAEANNLYLVFDAKDRGTFKSAAWRQEYNPDLCFVTTNEDRLPLRTSRQVLQDFPHSQHRPVLIEIGTSIPLVYSHPRPRWNFKKAKWDVFAENLDKCLGWIPPKANNYERLVGAIICAAKKAIPRGYRKEYIPGWDETCEQLYEEFLKTHDQQTANDLLRSLDATRRAKWIQTVESLSFQTSSREAWSLLQKLGGGKRKARENNLITANKIAAHILSTSRAPRDKGFTRQIKRKLRALKTNCAERTEHTRPFSISEITTALKDVKTGKAPGSDGVHPEFLLHCGKYAKRWLAEFFSDIMETGIIPPKMKQSKIIAILKPGKTHDDPKNYRPIALLSAIYKLLERLLYNRISPVIFEKLPVEQAGFRPSRSCADQVLALTTFIEAGFQMKQKTSAAFIDLSAAYDTVWRHGLIYKFLQVIPCQKTTRLIDNMLNCRNFSVIIGNDISAPKTLNNGLPQGSVLAPLLFSLYLSDMPETQCRKFGYADDWAIATQHSIFETTEEFLSSDLNRLGKYFRQWRLRPNPNKTEVTCFHLCNRFANRTINVDFEGNRLRHNTHPKYLGVTLDRTLSYKEHLTKLAMKLRSRNNILHKLCGTSWGSSADTLRTSALGLVYSAAEYCAPVWLNSTHTQKVDTQLNEAMRIISGTIRSTPTYWLPVLSYIPPPDARRKCALMREYHKILDNPQLPLLKDVAYAERRRLKSRQPAIATAKDLLESKFDVLQSWTEQWRQNCPAQCRSMPCIKEKPPGFHQPRAVWTTLNRIRTGHGRCADALYKWGKIPSPECDCGAERQTVQHIVNDCRNRAYCGTFSDFLCGTGDFLIYIKNLDVKL